VVLGIHGRSKDSEQNPKDTARGENVQKELGERKPGLRKKRPRAGEIGRSKKGLALKISDSQHFGKKKKTKKKKRKARRGKVWLGRGLLGGV